MLQGKGMFIWNIENAEGGDIAEIVGKAKVAGMSHLLFKIADGVKSFNEFSALNLASECWKQGIEPWGWGFTYGNDPVAEGRKAAQRCNELPLEGFVVNAEGHYKNTSGKAQDYMIAFLGNLIEPDVPIGLSSYRYPVKYHSDFPWNEFLGVCDFVMPQVYWVEGDPVDNLTGTLADYDELFAILGYSMPIFPTGSAYSEHGWTASAEEVQRFMEACEQLELPGVNFWEWTQMKNNGLWPTIRDYEWAVGDITNPEPTLEFRVAMLENQSETLEQNLTDFSARVENRVIAIEDNVSKASTDIESILAKLVKLEGRQLDTANKLARLDTKHVALAEDVTDLLAGAKITNANIQGIVKKIGGIQENIDDLYAQDEEQKADIAGLEMNVEIVDASIGAEIQAHLNDYYHQPRMSWLERIEKFFERGTSPTGD